MTFKSIISRFPDHAYLANALDVSPVTVRQWGNRKSIPARYWGQIVNIAQASKINLTFEELANAAAKQTEAAE